MNNNVYPTIDNMSTKDIIEYLQEKRGYSIRNSGIMRKWEFITQELERIYAPKDVIQASQTIDDGCARIYGENAHTVNWLIVMEDYIKEKDLDYKQTIIRLQNTIGQASLCTACEREDNCRQCELAEKVGRCIGLNTPYDIVSSWIGEQSPEIR